MSSISRASGRSVGERSHRHRGQVEGASRRIRRQPAEGRVIATSEGFGGRGDLRPPIRSRRRPRPPAGHHDRPSQEEGSSQLLVGTHRHGEEPACERDPPSARRSRVLPIPGSPSTVTAANLPPWAPAIPSSSQRAQWVVTTTADRSDARGDRRARMQRRRPAARSSSAVPRGAPHRLSRWGPPPASLSLQRSPTIPRRTTEPVAGPTHRLSPPRIQRPRRERQAAWAPAARIASSARPIEGRSPPTVHLEDGCASRWDARPSFPRTTRRRSAGFTRRPRTDTPSVETRNLCAP